MDEQVTSIDGKDKYRAQRELRQRKAAAAKLNQDQREYHAQVGRAATKLLQQILFELDGVVLTPVGDCSNRAVTGQRASQVSIIKESISAVQLLMKFQNQLAEQFDIKKTEEAERKGENVLLFRSAEKLLKQAGK